jgi:hypothetical protein
MKSGRAGYSYSFIAVLFLLFIFAVNALPLSAQTTATGTLRGKVTDPSGAVIPGATVTAIAANGQKTTVTTNHQGVYEIKNLPPGKYTVNVMAKGFATDNEVDVNVPAGPPQQFDIALGIQVEQQQVVVQSEANTVQLSPSENSSSVVIKGKDLEALSDDPDELQSELEALAGPSAGPNGGQIYIDGFTGGQLPPKSSIREIRVNSDPFSAEYDKLGYGRIEIFTKPGTDNYHGQFFFNESNSALNSNNPFIPDEPSNHSEIYNGSLGGPLSKKASFYVSAQRRNINDVSSVNALVPDSTFTNPVGVPFVEGVPNPSTRTNISPRIDYQVSKNNTLTAHYQFEQEKNNNEGIQQTSLSTLGYNEVETENTLQLSDTQVIGSNVVNETHFQYRSDKDNIRSQDGDPLTQVLGFFSSGGNSQGQNLDTTDSYEIQNYTSVVHRAHQIKFGVRERVSHDSNFSNAGFNGTFVFPSLAAYDVTQAGLLNGLTPAQSRTACLAASTNPETAQCGASQFSITTGQPLITNTYADTGIFADDTWRARRNITVSYGLRYETQNQIHDHGNFAPRVGFAWGLGGKNGSPKTVLRAGSGVFYERFQQEYLLNAERLNGITQQQFVVSSPDCYPDPSTCPTTTISAPTVYRVSPDLKTPYIIQSAASVERQLAKATTVSVTYLNSRGVHEFLSENINAPLPGTFIPTDPTSGTRPFGAAAGNIYEYVSEGIFKQNQVITNVRFALGAKLSLFGFYMLNWADSDAGNTSSFPSNQYNLAQDYGRSFYDRRHFVFVGGSINLPEHFNLFPFIFVNSGTPFNITLGQDLNGDSIFNDRPGLVSTTRCSTVSVNGNIVCSPWGTFNSAPAPGDRLVPINYGTGPTNATVNLRLSRTFGFGPEKKGASGGPRGGGYGGGRRGGPPGGGLGPGGLNGGGGSNPFAMGGGTGRRYNLTFSISARNLFNSENLATPVGDINSSRFGQSIGIAGGPFSTQTSSRRIDLQASFSF